MKLKFTKGEINLYRFLRRKANYHPHPASGGDSSYIKSISRGDYPRFHIYPKEEDGFQILSLHLDMKKPSYEGSHAHNAEYESEQVKKEARRLKSLLAAKGIEASIKS